MEFLECQFASNLCWGCYPPGGNHTSSSRKHQRGICARIVLSGWYDQMSALLIISNAVFLGVTIDMMVVEKQIDETQGYKLLIANVTNLLTNGYLLAKQTCNAMIVSEHSIRQFQIPQAIQSLGGSCKMCLSELDPEVSNNLGGVGIIQFDNKHINKPKAIHPGLQEVCGNGRVDIYCIEPLKINSI